jgi:hypothetical protein
MKPGGPLSCLLSRVSCVSLDFLLAQGGPGGAGQAGERAPEPGQPLEEAGPGGGRGGQEAAGGEAGGTQGDTLWEPLLHQHQLCCLASRLLACCVVLAPALRELFSVLPVALIVGPGGPLGGGCGGGGGPAAQCQGRCRGRSGAGRHSRGV